MALKNKYFDPKEYYYKVIFICVLMAFDILFNSFTQFFSGALRAAGPARARPRRRGWRRRGAPAAHIFFDHIV